jgi:hypothetical protein
LYEALQNHKHIWIKKSRGIGLSTFLLRYIGYCCVSNIWSQNARVCLVTVNVTGVAIGQGQQQQERKPTLEEVEGKTTRTESSETSNDGNTPLTLPFSSGSSDKEEGSSESQEEEGGGGGVTTNNQDNNDNVNPDDDDEPTIYWDLD